MAPSAAPRTGSGEDGCRPHRRFLPGVSKTEGEPARNDDAPARPTRGLKTYSVTVDDSGRLPLPRYFFFSRDAFSSASKAGEFPTRSPTSLGSSPPLADILREPVPTNRIEGFRAAGFAARTLGPSTSASLHLLLRAAPPPRARWAHLPPWTFGPTPGLPRRASSASRALYHFPVRSPARISDFVSPYLLSGSASHSKTLRWISLALHRDEDAMKRTRGNEARSHFVARNTSRAAIAQRTRRQSNPATETSLKRCGVAVA